MKSIKRFTAIVLTLAIITLAFTACSFLSPGRKLLGAWMDSTNTMGYEFKDNGIVTITYANFTVPIINVKWTGQVDGTYTVSKDANKNNTVQINCTVLAQTLSKTYTFSVDKSALTLTDVSDGSVTALLAYTPQTTANSTSAAQ